MTEFRGELAGEGLNTAIVASEFIEKDGGAIKKMREGCLDRLSELGARVDIFYVPGAFEIPTVAKKILETKKYNAIITLGAIVRGETAHFDFVAGNVARKIADLSVEYNIPVIFGVLTTDTTEQTVVRARLGVDYAEAAIRMANLLKEIKK